MVGHGLILLLAIDTLLKHISHQSPTKNINNPLTPGYTFNRFFCERADLLGQLYHKRNDIHGYDDLGSLDEHPLCTGNTLTC